MPRQLSPAASTGWDARKVTVPEGTSRCGTWTVERFEISEKEADFESLRAAIQGNHRRTWPGNYTCLRQGKLLVMSDTVIEILDHSEAMNQIRDRGGRVLINGLGLGMLVKYALEQPNVEHVDVVELDWEVIELVGSHYLGKGATRRWDERGMGGPGKEHYRSDSADGRLTIWQDDAFVIKWPTGTRWSVAWHDVWPTISEANLAGMITLHRSYGRRVDWQGSWAREFCK